MPLKIGQIEGLYLPVQMYPYSTVAEHVNQTIMNHTRLILLAENFNKEFGSKRCQRLCTFGTALQFDHSLLLSPLSLMEKRISEYFSSSRILSYMLVRHTAIKRKKFDARSQGP